MSGPQGLGLDRCSHLEGLSPDELSGLYAAIRGRVRGYDHRNDEDVELLDPGTHEHADALDELSRIEFEMWHRQSAWLLRMRSAIESSVAAATPGAEVHVAMHFTYPGPPSRSLALVEHSRADPLAVMALIGFSLRVRPLPSGPADHDKPWAEVFLGGVDARTGKVYDRNDYVRERFQRRDLVYEPGLQEPDLWPSLLIGGPAALLSRASQLVSLFDGALAEFGSNVAKDVVASVIEAAIDGPPSGRSSDEAARAAYASWKLLLDAVSDVAEELTADFEESLVENADADVVDAAEEHGVDTDGDGVPDMTPAPKEVLERALAGSGDGYGGPSGNDVEWLPLPDDHELSDHPGRQDDAEVTVGSLADSGTRLPGGGDPDDISEERDDGHLDFPDDDELVDQLEGIDPDGAGGLDLTAPAQDMLDQALDGADEVCDAVAPPDHGGPTL